MLSDLNASITGAGECRNNAKECLRRARATRDSTLKAALLSMARTWTALAVQTERMHEMLRTRSDREATGGGSLDESHGTYRAAINQETGKPPVATD